MGYTKILTSVHAYDSGYDSDSDYDSSDFDNDNGYKIIDDDGDSQAANLNINFGADGPNADTPVQISGIDWMDKGYSVNGDGFWVSDDGSKVHVTDSNGVLLTSGGKNLVYLDDEDGGLLAVIDESGGKTIFHVDVVDNYHYTVVMEGQVDGVGGTQQVEINFTGNQGGGIHESLDLYGGDVRVHVTAEDGISGDVDSVNWSQQGMGVDNDFIDAEHAEALTLQFFQGDTDTMVSLNEVTFELDSLNQAHGNTPTDQATWTAYKTGSTDPVGSGTIDGVGIGAGADQSFTVSILGGFDTIVFTGGAESSYRVENMTWTEETATSSPDIELSYEVTAVDGDGDTDSAEFDVTIELDSLCQSEE